MEALFMQQSSDQYFTTDQDLALQRMIYDHLNWDKRVSPFDIQVEVVEGNVILSGIVDAHYKKKAAYELIESLEGVWEIENRIQVDTHMYRTDEHIKEILLSELRRLSLKPGENVTVNVQDGVVRLEGIVYRRRIKAYADEAAWELSCVKDVLNLITLKEPIPKPGLILEPIPHEEHPVSISIAN
jgi:hyperosmotically inducible protein